MEVIDHSAGLSEVPGFEIASAACDIRAKGDFKRLDLTVCRSVRPCAAAGVFTTNEVFAAPVHVCRQLLKSGKPLHGFVANSGNANACTGEQGERDAVKMAELAACAAGLEKGTFFVASTGRIGRQMPMDLIAKGIAACANDFGSDEKHGRDASQAILTSDTRPKTVTVRFTNSNGKTITLAGMAKGAGMIQPGMATMLCFIATDAVVSRNRLQKTLSDAVRSTFNCISVDGDMSTNDTVVMLANGASDAEIREGTPDAENFKKAVLAVCDNLAEKIVGDGEKITKVVEVKVESAPSNEAAEKIARSIGNSLLVKASWCGEDPNWGRLADAAGYARAGLDHHKLDIDYDETPVLRGGQPIDANLPQWRQIVKKNRFSVRIRLNIGQGAFRLLATDLTEAYVTFNKSE